SHGERSLVRLRQSPDSHRNPPRGSRVANAYMRRHLKNFTIATLILAGSMLPAAAAHAARHMEVALQDDQVFLNQSWYGRTQAFQRAEELGVTRLRVNFIWAREVATAHHRHTPKDPGYNWWHFDSLIDEAAAHGMRVE